METNIRKAFSKTQEFLRTNQLDGWLLYDYRGMNPFMWEVLGPVPNVTRPCWFLIPSIGIPRILAHHVDVGRFANTNLTVIPFSNQRQMETGLRRLLRGRSRIAMEYSPDGMLPRVSRIDAGTIERIRNLGMEIVSSADLIQDTTQRWTASQLEWHQSAAAKLSQIVQEAFTYVGLNLLAEITESDVAEFIHRRFRDLGLMAEDGPVVAANAHSGDPHYDPNAGSSILRRGDWLLIDLWAKEQEPDAVYADITWVGYIGEVVPERYQRIFELVSGARDAALNFMVRSHQRGQALQGWEVDRVARNFISRRGFGRYFTHRLGHSLGGEVHGNTVNLDSWETRDTRKISEGFAVTIEPGVYFPEFGVRSEIDVYLSENGPVVTTSVQREIFLIN